MVVHFKHTAKQRVARGSFSTRVDSPRLDGDVPITSLAVVCSIRFVDVALVTNARFVDRGTAKRFDDEKRDPIGNALQHNTVIIGRAGL